MDNALRILPAGYRDTTEICAKTGLQNSAKDNYGDLAVGLALRDKRGDLAFARRQPAELPFGGPGLSQRGHRT
jgi:hypothetical protein